MCAARTVYVCMVDLLLKTLSLSPPARGSSGRFRLSIELSRENTYISISARERVCVCVC